ncbi:MAG: hypothetical protein ABI222_13765 [Opitutaceae bacterium]
MKQKTNIRFHLLAAAAVFGLALSASAQTTDAASTAVPADTSWGQLGSGYSGAAFTYTDIGNGSPSALRGFGLDYNLPMRAGMDWNFAYNWGRADTGALRLTQQAAMGGLTAFTAFAWGKPYVQALAGWEWQRGLGASDNSFAYTLGTGVEFQVAKPIVVTPFVNFVRATSYSRSEVDYGVKTAYRLTKEWSLSASVQYNAVVHQKDDIGYTAGVQYHF